MTRYKLSSGWRWFLAAAFVAGTLLRLVHVHDMEYKEDEEYNFTQSQVDAWPWVGMPSGVFIPNPGMSVWAFRALALVSGASTPTGLATAVQVFALIGIAALLAFAVWGLRASDDRRPWLWATALALVNPFAVFYQRKLWPEPLLLPFSMLMLAGWWRRETRLGAFAWGFVGAWLGQIHMSGFFYAAAFPLFTLTLKAQSVPRSRVRWLAWLAGSVLGALPLIPWAHHALTHPIHETITRGWGEALQAKFWVFWITNPTGLHLGNPLGLLRGQSNWAQISDFVRYPLIGGQATYLCGLAHATALAASLAILLPGLMRWLGRVRASAERGPHKVLKQTRTDLSMALGAGIFGFGLLLTLSSVVIRRYYVMVSFPLEFVWLARMGVGSAMGGGIAAKIAGRRRLAALWISGLVISASFVHYVHVNEGATQGDYGDAYHVVMRKRTEAQARAAAATPAQAVAPGAQR